MGRFKKFANCRIIFDEKELQCNFSNFEGGSLSYLPKIILRERKIPKFPLMNESALMNAVL